MGPKVIEDVKIPLRETIYPPTVEEFFEGKQENEKRPRDSVFLYMSAFAASLLTFGLGSIVVWTSPAASRLLSNNTSENPLGTAISTAQLSLIGGLPMFGSIFGPLLLTKLCDIIGRKKSMICLSVMLLLSTITLAFSKTLLLYYTTRLISGLGMGASLACVSIFLSEISEDHNRGAIGCFIGLSFPLGNLYVYVIGPLLSIKNFTLLCSIPYFILLIAFVIFVPESPVFYASKRNSKAALKSLKKLRNKSIGGIEKEYAKMIYTIQQSEQNEGGVRALFNTRSFRKGLTISIGLCCIQQLTGVAAILAFAAPLFDAAHLSLSGHTIAILIGSVKLGSVLLATFIIERSGRRPLLMTSLIGTGISLFALGLFFYLKSIHSCYVDYILWLPIVAIFVYFVFYGIGIGVIPTSIMSELFPSNIRSTAVSVTTVCYYTLGLGITISFPIVAKLLGETWCLWAYSIGSFGGYIFIYFLVPEIKGKSVLEVQEILSK